MKDWFADVPEKDRDKVKDLYSQAKTFETTLEVLRSWGQVLQ